MGTKLTVETIQILPHRLFLLLKLDDILFNVSTWFPSINLHAMASSLGELQTRKLLFHSILFDLQSFMSAGTEVIDVTAFDIPIHGDLASLWAECGKNQWAEWRYENNLPYFPTPKLVGCNSLNHQRSVLTTESGILLMFSGGKDSLASSIVLDEMGVNYDTFFVLQSKDGRMDLQRQLIGNVLKSTKSHRHHEVMLFEDYIMAPIEACTKYKFKGIADGFAETVSCMFKSVLYAAALNFDSVVLGNEAAADEANFTWDLTGEAVNHQWGKTLTAETSINSYVNKHLISNLHFTSPLRKMHDPDIFGVVKSRLEALRHCHSCNKFKPWCKRCSKCCYIWLSYCAYIGYNFAYSVFRENLFDISENVQVFRKLYIGPKPFDCVGRKEDVIQAFKICIERGINGRAIDEFKSWMRG